MPFPDLWSACVAVSPADDPALRALFWPFHNAALVLPAAPVLFLGARIGDWPFVHPHVTWRCEQPFLPFARPLRERGIEVEPQLQDTGFAMTLLLPPRQRDVSRALLARALTATAPGGWIVAAATNNEGARSLEADLRALAGPVQSLSKHKSRVVFVRVDPDNCDARLHEEWRALDALREVQSGDERFWTRPGLFAWDRVDPASALLASELPAGLRGRVADPGGGWGYLSMQLLRRCAGIETLDLFEADARALDAAQRNLDATRSTPAAQVACRVHWHDVSAGLPGQFDVIVSNPPFHLGRADAPQLGRSFIASAADALADDGQIWLVANRHLPYEELLRERFSQVRMPVQRDGYKILHGSGVKR